MTAALVIGATTATAASADLCTDSFERTVQMSLQTEVFLSELVFKTHDVFNVGGETIVLHPQGNRVASADVLHVLTVRSFNGSTAVITGNIAVIDGVVLQRVFCSSQIELAS